MTLPPSVPVDALDEARQLIAAANADATQLRLFGGIAIYLHVPDWAVRRATPRKDIDFVICSKDRQVVEELLERRGYVPDRNQNALYGHKQLYFRCGSSGRPIDVVVDRLEMCHTLDLRERLGVHSETLALADLLLSKLQIVQPERKDLLDVIALLAKFPLTDDDAGISTSRITNLLAADWGWWRTVTANLTTVVEVMPTLTTDESDFGHGRVFDPAAQAKELRDRIDARPKSMKWKIRAKIGDRAVWYEVPEEVEH